MKRWLILVYGLTCYLMFLVVFVWAIAFIGNLYLPQTLDATPRVSWQVALMINVGLLGVFAVQHSLMARPFFKAWLTRFIPMSAERSTYVLASNAAMILLYLCWQPVGSEVWHVSSTVFAGAIYVLYFGGWALVFASTCMINHFDLFGLRQVWLQFKGQPYKPLEFRTPGLYKYVRHPLYVGWLTVFWSAPVMTLGHLVFAVGCTVYILVAIRLEERDLVTSLGVEYSRYRDEVPMLIPNPGFAAGESGVHTAHR